MLEHAREEAEPKCDVSRERTGTRGKQNQNYLIGSPCFKGNVAFTSHNLVSLAS